jgi:chromosomal replication initiator protein
MSLGQLVDYFQPYLPTEYGKKLSLFSKSRKREIVELRMMFCFLARSMKYKLSTIGSFLGGRDHTTVMHNVATFINLMETNDQFRSLFQEILNHIKENHESPTLGILDTPQRKSKPALLP